MLAEVHDGVRVEGATKPGVEREVAVGRREVGIVIAPLGVDVVAPRRLDRDGHIAATQGRQDECLIG